MRPILVLLLAATGCSANVDGGAGLTAAPESPTATPTPTEEPTEPPTPRPTREPTPEPEEREQPTVTAYGFTANAEFGSATYAVVVANPNATWVPTFVNLSITFYDAAGTVLTTQDEYLTAILPEGEAAVAGDAFDAGEAAEMEVQISRLSESDWQEIDEGEAGRYQYDRVQTVREQFGGMKTTGLVLSEFESEQNNIRVNVVYYDSAGAIVGGAFTYVDQVAPGGQAAFEASTFVTLPDVAETRVFAEVGFGS